MLQHLTHPQPARVPIAHTVAPELGMRLLEALKPVGLTVELHAEHTENTAGALIAHVVDAAVRDALLPDVGPHILLVPEGHGRGYRALGVIGVAPGFEPLLGAEL